MYLSAVKESISVARGTSHSLYGRDIPLCPLMHVSAMSAHMMPRVIQAYREAGFRFVTIGQAESDPAYRPDIDLSLPGRAPGLEDRPAEGREIAPGDGSRPGTRFYPLCRTSGVEPVTVSVADLRSTEFGPAEMVKVPGSTTFPCRAFHKREIVGREIECDRSTLTGLKRHALEALELDHRPGDGCLVVANVELDHFVAGAAPVFATSTAICAVLICGDARREDSAGADTSNAV